MGEEKESDMTGSLWSPMKTAPYDTWFLALVEPPKATQSLLVAIGLPPELPSIIVARKIHGDKPGQVRCSKHHALYTATGWNIPPVMEEANHGKNTGVG